MFGHSHVRENSSETTAKGLAQQQSSTGPWLAQLHRLSGAVKDVMQSLLLGLSYIFRHALLSQ